LLVVAVIPATTTYAVLKHRAFNISVVIHRGLQWLMLKGVLQTLVVLPGAGLLFTLVTNSQRTVAEALWHNTISLSMVLLFGSMLVFRPRLTSWLERRFKLEFSACSRCNACYPFAEKCEADGEDLDPVPIDRDITRRYRPQCLLGRGGMGVVYRCQDLVLERPVAIKVIDVKDCATQTKLERALRESRAAARLNHPHIIVAHDLILDPGRAHIIMEYVPGDTLRTKLLKGRPDPRVAAIWFDQLLDGLSAAHDTGIVHRDLKPANIAIAEDSRGRPIVKILDFGIARLQGQMDPNTEAQATGELEALAETEPMLTRTGSVLGSFRYMSPEQINGGVADVRSDLFAVGLMIFEALTNESPFSGNTHVDRAKALKQPPRSLPAYSAADAELNRVLGKCLATDPPQRFQSAAEFRTNVIPLVAAYTGKPETKHAPAEASE
jgi:serine/threonine protein kinase